MVFLPSNAGRNKPIHYTSPHSSNHVALKFNPSVKAKSNKASVTLSSVQEAHENQGTQAKASGGLYGWARTSWQNSNIKRKHTRGWRREGWPWRNRDTLSEYAGKGLGKSKPIWSWIWQWMLRTMRRAFHRYISRKKRLRKTWAHCWTGQETWWQSTCRRLWYSLPSPSQPLLRRLTFRNPRSSRPVGKPSARRITLGNI